MRSCPICNKGSVITGGYSNRVRATKYNPTGKNRKQPNLQWAPLPVSADGTPGGPNGRPSRIKICTTCIKGGKNLTVKFA